jgi:hypothetical protein
MAIIQSGASSDTLTVDPTAKAARATLYAPDGSTISREQGAARAATDHGLPHAVLNDDNFRLSRGDRIGSMAVSLNNVLFSEPFEGSVISVPNRISLTTASFTQAQTAAGGLRFNNLNILTASAAALVQTNRHFPRYQRAPLHAKFRARVAHVANAVAEMGFGAPAGAASSPAVGAFFQVTASGVVQGVLTFNGVDQTTAPITMPGGWQSNFYVWDIVLDDDEAMFFVQNTETGLIIAERRIQVAASAVRLWNASRLPAFARLHFPTAPATAADLFLASLDVVMLDAFMNKPWSQVAAHMGMGGEVNPTTFAQAANYANSAAPASAALSNTTPGYTTLGGQFQFAAVAGAETDYALFGFTVPGPYSFVCTGIDISTFNMGAAVATTPTLLQWFASPDQTTVSLATATNRRVTLGAQSFAVAAPIGGIADRDVVRDFANAPLVTNPNRIMVIGLKMPVGTATASQIIRGVCAVKGYFE